MSSFVFDHVGLSVADLDAQRRFYAGALGMTTVEEHLDMLEAGVRTAILRADNGLKIELIERPARSSRARRPLRPRGHPGLLPLGGLRRRP